MIKLKNIRFLLPLLLVFFLAGCVPVVTITSPQDGDVFAVGEEITFSGKATDALAGDLPEDALAWTVDGEEIGTGAIIKKSDLAVGNHIVKLNATKGNRSSSAQITITVGEGGGSTTTVPNTTTTTISGGGTTTTAPATTTTTISNNNTCGDVITINEANQNASIDKPTTWTSNHLYVVEGQVFITATLTIEPGTIIKLKPSSHLDSSTAAIIANGTKEKPIVFTSYKNDSYCGDTNGDGSTSTPAAGDWDGIYLQANDSVFNYCQFYYGGVGNGPGSTLNIGELQKARITNCTFAHNKGYEGQQGALNAGLATSATVITGNTFYDNELPLSINACTDDISLDDSNVFHNPANPKETNTFNGIFCFTSGGDISRPTTWSETEVPFVITDLFIESTLTLGDNVIIKVIPNPDTRIGLASNGAIANHDGPGVFFTSYWDDAHGGDTNGDGNATSPASGVWGGIGLPETASCFHLWADWSNILYAKNKGCMDGNTTTINSRFTDNGNGTVTDARTGLIWLRNANPWGVMNWADATSACASLASGQAGLTDGSTAGQWRLPSKEELEGIGTDPPATWESGFPSVPWLMPGAPFTNVQSSGYWSSTTDAGYPSYAWGVYMDGGGVNSFSKSSNFYYAWPVRAGN